MPGTRKTCWERQRTGRGSGNKENVLGATENWAGARNKENVLGATENWAGARNETNSSSTLSSELQATKVATN